MSDNITRPARFDEEQKMNKAQDTFIYEAITYMKSGYPMEKGQGVVSLNSTGDLEIKGLNADKSIIDWDVKLSGTIKGTWPEFELVTNSNVAKNYSIVHKENVNYKTGTSQEEYFFTGRKDKGEMSGSCQSLDDGSKVCDLKFTGGTAHVEQSAAKNGTVESTIGVKTKEGEQSINLTYTTSKDIATYSYEKSKK